MTVEEKKEYKKLISNGEPLEAIQILIKQDGVGENLKKSLEELESEWSNQTISYQNYINRWSEIVRQMLEIV
jgi:hypothetical protein